MAFVSILPAKWEVPEEFRRRLGARAGRQRVMIAEGHLLLVLHRPPRPEEHERVGRFFWRKPDGTWSSSDLGTGPGALKKHLNEYADLVERYDRSAEDATLADDYAAVLEAVAPICRSAQHLHQVLQEARKAIPTDRDLIDSRDRSYEIERMAELLYGGTKNALDFAVVKRAEDQARASHQMSVSAHRLNVMAAFFFPLATLSAIFGVNLDHGYEHFSPPWPFLTVMAGGLAVGSLITLMITRKPK